MHERALDPTTIVDDLLGPELPAPGSTAQPPRSAPVESPAIRELMDWVSNEVFGRAETS
jgi:hypothetical protein